ncbi:MAG: hypothetical protein C0592_01525 [Marinilabiliales bacterium]|nr:MAG: hypothetical protein C0592_01525 [Marinilabiliales bacterium]
MEIYSAYRRPNSQKSNTLKNEVFIEWKKKKKSELPRNRVKTVSTKNENDESWLLQVQKRWAVLREKAMEYFFPESVA